MLIALSTEMGHRDLDASVLVFFFLSTPLPIFNLYL